MAFPGTYNFNYYRGDTAEFVIRPKSNSNNNEAFDLTGYTAIFTIASKRGPIGAAPAFSSAASAVVNDVTNIITCKIIPSLGRTLEAGTYVYDVQITNATPDPDVIFTLLTGTITVTDDITGAGNA
jgi:hypothetical protein